MRFLFLAFAICLSGCATKYQSMGFAGGVDAQQMTADTFRIVARGNAYTGTNTVQDYTMLKAAETTKQNGGTHFVVISAADASRTSEISTPGYAHTTLVGNTATTTYSPGMTETVFKPGQDTYIRILTLKPNQPVPAGAVPADEIIQFVGSRVKRG